MNPPKRAFDEVSRAMIMAVMFQAGILPLEKTTLDMRRALSQLPVEEARILRRKFRKLWRRALKKDALKLQNKEQLIVQRRAKVGIGKINPSREERNARKQLVFDAFWRDVIEPMYKNFRNPNATDKVGG
jgi:hypothetical protein